MSWLLSLLPAIVAHFAAKYLVRKSGSENYSFYGEVFALLMFVQYVAFIAGAAAF